MKIKGWERLRYVVICLVTTIWTINFFAPIFFHSYIADPAINTVFMTIVGSLFAGGELLKKLKSDSKEESGTKSAPKVPPPRRPSSKQSEKEKDH